MFTFRELLDCPDPVLTANQNGVITQVNQAFCDTFAWKSSDLVGKLLAEIVPPPLRDAHHLGFSRFLVTEVSNILERELTLEVFTGRWQTVPSVHYIMAQKGPEGWEFACRFKVIDHHE